MKVYVKKKNCRLCFSKKLEKIYSYRKIPIGEEFLKQKKHQPLYNLDLFLCKNCYLVQITDIIHPSILYKNYLYQTKTSPDLEKHFSSYAKTVINKFRLKKKSIVLDIGCNDGILLKKFKQMGLKTIGIEPASHIAKICKKKGIEIYNSFFNKKICNFFIKKKIYPKIITSNNVFANIEDLKSWVLNIRNILTNDSVYCLESYYIVDLIKNRVFDFIYHEHLSSFSLTSINFLCDQYNLKLIDYDKTRTKGGSIRYYIVKKENKIKQSIKLKAGLDYEESLGVRTIKFYKKGYNFFSSEIKKFKIYSKKNNLKKFDIFGASITCINLIYQFDLQKKITNIFDDNKLKHGLLSPGFQLKVKKFESSAIEKKNNLIILPWRFKKLIIKKHKKLIQQYPKVFCLLPKFSVLKL